MTTITAVELRKNMGEIFRRAAAGEEFAVTYRGKDQLQLSRKQASVGKKTMTGLEVLRAAPRKPSGLDPNKSFKELYHEHLEEKYGKYAHD
jgi:antitoxin (DNA-binding transcriptional repressor) of toxin-antitoxin stability system